MGRIGVLAVLMAMSAGAASAQVCTRPTPSSVDCAYLNSEPEAVTVKATARLQHLRGSSSGAVVLVLDGRTCSVAAARWQLGTGEADAICLQKGGYARHRAQARLYNVAGARPLSFEVTVEPSALGLERLPLDTGKLSPKPAPYPGWARTPLF